MAGFTSNIINLISDNLRERYHSGFPVIKELIQNADDAKASRFVFGVHSGFPSCKHPLLQGSGLWCFNNGAFKVTDKRHIRSFAENAKAGEDSTIGKFGLGMKSVFHLCEAFFYIAYDGTNTHSEFLNPWDDGDKESEHPHMDWEQVWNELQNADISYIQQAFADYLDADNHWFLLWIPLRCKAHLQAGDGEEYGSIINSFPGDDPNGLDFLKEEMLAEKLGSLLPLLANLQDIRFVSLGATQEAWKPFEFCVSLQAEPRMNLTDNTDVITSAGEITKATAQGEQIVPVWGRRTRNTQVDSLFHQLKQDSCWPETRYRDDKGRQQTASDKSSAEGAILISHQTGSSGQLTLQWAVFLPLEDSNEKEKENNPFISIPIQDSNIHYRIVLHGQFLIDSGRRGIHSFDTLKSQHGTIDDVTDEQSLRCIWNQALAQEICLPLILPALHEYIEAHSFKDNEVGKLTTALKKAIDHFGYVNFITAEYSWFRELLPSGGQWRLHKNSDAVQILPLPAPPQDSPNLPWEVLAQLEIPGTVVFKDKDSEAIIADSSQWTTEGLKQVLQEPTCQLFAKAAQLNYFNKFLDTITSNSIRNDENVQQALLKFVRGGIRHHDKKKIEENKTKIISILKHIANEKLWGFEANLDDDILKALWRCETNIFPIPSFLNPEKVAKDKPSNAIAAEWLENLKTFESDNALTLKKEILKSLESKGRLELIKANSGWKITSAYNAKESKIIAVSYEALSASKSKGSLFGSTSGKNPHEKVNLLAKCLNDGGVLVINASEQDLFTDSSKEKIPQEDSSEAILTALIKSDAALNNDIKLRKALLEKCNAIDKENSDAKKGLRYLLHADLDKKNSTETLWVNDRKQNPVWEKLWTEMQRHKQSEWSVINRDLANIVYNQWKELAIQEVEEDSILNELESNYKNISRDAFTQKEQYEILCKIKSETLWKNLPWHKTIDGHWVSIKANNTYLKTSIELPDALKNGLDIIEPINELKDQQIWIKKLDEAVAINIALDSGKSSEYNKEILTWLGKDKLNPELQEKLKSTKWLLLKNNQILSPNDIIAITGLEDAIQKLAASASYAYASDKDLHDSIIQHSAFDKKVKPLFATKSESVLGTLALLMNEVSIYAIGSLCESDDIGKLAKTLADCESAPSWGIIKALCDAKISNDNQKEKFTLDDCKNHLLTSLNRLPEKEALINIFDWLQKKNTQQAQAAYAFYLRQMVEAGYVEELLPQIKLLAKDGKSWKLASELCIDAPGISSSSILCIEQQRILSSFIKKSESKEANENTTKTRPVDILGYLKKIEGEIKNSQLGLLMVLLGKTEDAKDMLYPFSIDTIINELGWQKPEMGDYWINEYTKKWTSEFAFEDGFDFNLFSIEKCENEILVTNLLGGKTKAYLTKDINNIIIKKGHRNRKEPLKNNNRETLTLDLYIWNEEVLNLLNDKASVIKKTCSYLWMNLFGQDDSNLENLWNKLSETHQLDIAVTRSVILKHAAFYLNTLGANKENELKKALSDVENAETRLAEAENNEDKDKQVEWQKKAKEHQEGLIKTLQNKDASQHILEKVQSKLREFQYEPDSILFEVFQNADDAVLQLARCESFPDKNIDIVEQCQNFRIIVCDNTVYAMHWGRPINDRCSTEAQERWRGYGKDLEKMLILSASDKPDDKAVTGRFGLGFKSVFLACDAPKIISGDLKVNIVAGFLPEVWKEAENAQSLLRSYTENPRYSGTLVALPLRPGIQPDALLNRFKQQQALLCMTSKMLRHISIGEGSFTWSPKLLGLNKKLEFGKLDNKNYLVYRDEVEEGFAAVIMRVSARGFELLKVETPSFWVVAPTRETASVGFIISAPFQIDAGRGKLAGSGTHDDQNKALAAQLGKRFGFALADLYKMDWAVLMPQLGLAEDVSKTEWWTSLWKQFSDSDSWKKDDSPFHLSKSFVKSLLFSWSENTGLIPNGLPQEQASLVQADSISHSIPENWHSNNALQYLRGWAAFDKEYPNNKVVAAWVMQIWRELKPDSRVAELGLYNLIELIEDKKCDANLADKLGGFFGIVYKNENLNESDEKQLGEIQFLSKQGTYQPSSKLLLEHGADKEEKLRVAFSPDEHVLSDTYQTNGKQFFRTCRKRMGSVDDLEQWFISASAEKQDAALRYLIEGSNGDKIADVVSNKKQGKWFDNVSVDQITKNWKPEDQNKLKKKLQSNIEVETGRSTSNSPAQQNSVPEKLTTLEEIYTWWKSYGAQYQQKYLSFLYPYGTPPNLRFDNNGNYDRESWMLLLGIGIYQRLGRTRDFQTKGFLEYFQSKGWWQILCTSPDQDRDAWIRLLYEYSQDQQFDEKYSHWMTMFPNLFKVALYLDQYVQILEGLQHRKENEILLALTPNLDRSLQGAGIGYIPPINRTLGKGFNLVVRELLRLGVIDNTAAHPYAYMPVPRVKKILERCEGIDIEKLESSKHIHKVLCESLGETGAIFDGDYDIPFLVLAHDKKLLKEVTQIELPEESEEEI